MIARRHTTLRLFLSLWLVFCLHWATDFVREHFLVVSIVDDHTFALDDFAGLHPDIFIHTDGHAYHGANPGISMLGAVPYFVLSPLVDRVVARELAARPAEGAVAELEVLRGLCDDGLARVGTAHARKAPRLHDDWSWRLAHSRRTPSSSSRTPG